MPFIRKHLRRTQKRVSPVREHFRQPRLGVSHGDRTIPESEDNEEINEYAIKSAIRDIDWKIDDLKELAIQKRAIVEDDTQYIRQIQRLEEDKEYLKGLL